MFLLRRILQCAICLLMGSFIHDENCLPYTQSACQAVHVFVTQVISPSPCHGCRMRRCGSSGDIPLLRRSRTHTPGRSIDNYTLPAGKRRKVSIVEKQSSGSESTVKENRV